MAPRLIITAGHNVFNNPEWGSGWADAVEVTPGLSAQGAPPPFGSQTVQGRNQLLASDGWVRGGDPLVDYAGIILNQPFDSRTGSFAMNLFAPDLLQQMRLNVAGYPQQSDRIPPLTMWTGQGLLLSNGVRQQSLWYQIDTTPGESGSPLMYVPADAVNEKGDVVKPVYSVGVHNYGQAESNRNSATRITQPVLDNFSQWLKLAGG